MEFWGSTGISGELTFRGYTRSSGGAQPADLSGAYSSRLSRIRNDLAENAGPNKSQLFEEMLIDAANLQWVIGSGAFGPVIKTIHSRNPNAGLRLACAFSRALLNVNPIVQDELAELQGLALMAPGMQETLDLVSTRSMRLEMDVSTVQSREAAQTAKAELGRLEELVSGKRKEIEILHQVYHEKLKLEAPAKYWADTASRAGSLGWAALAVFAAMIIMPLWLAQQNWAAIDHFLQELIKPQLARPSRSRRSSPSLFLCSRTGGSCAM
ncbi:MAG: hypothetical protein JWP26_1179 [Devosia sp.]|nr:hypothetical protein [Devosia sp.]